jgi:hypothetical protein
MLVEDFTSTLPYTVDIILSNNVEMLATLLPLLY